VRRQQAIDRVEEYGAGAVDTVRFLVEHLSVAHFAAGPRSQELRCSRAHCASTVECRAPIFD